MKLPFRGRFGFDTEAYVRKQSEAIIERASRFHKLYLEFGGKLVNDYHAARVLPGYDTEAKIAVIKKLSKEREIEFLLCVNSDYLEEEKFSSLGISYRDFTLRMVEGLRKEGFEVSTAVLTFFKGQKKAKEFMKVLRKEGLNTYTTPFIEGYPKDIRRILSPEGFGKKPFIRTKKEIVIVTGAGPKSGKMATCLTMVYQDYLRGKDSGYAKFETFPIWNLPLKSAINMAYEAATADIGDYNLIDEYYKKAYGKLATSYNRDFEVFSLLKKIISKLSKSNAMKSYRSPTDMGINMAKEGITSLKLCEDAAKQELVRRYFKYYCGFLKGKNGAEAYERVKKLMRKAKVSVKDRKVVELAREAKEKSLVRPKVGCAIELPKKVITARNSERMHAEAGAVIKALKHLAKAKGNVLNEEEIRMVRKMRSQIYGKENENLTLKEALLLLAASSSKNSKARECIERINELRGAELHTTYMMSDELERFFLKLGINATSDGEREVKEVVF